MARLKRKIMVLLTIAATVSLILGILEDTVFYNSETSPQKIDWVDGIAIIIAIVIVILVGSINDYQKERQFSRLNAKKEERLIKIRRNGEKIVIASDQVMVGDICMVEPGDVITVDGIIISAYNLTVDESSITGETEGVRKAAVPSPHASTPSLPEQVAAYTTTTPPENGDCFVISSSKVLEGSGTFLVLAVGLTSFYGKNVASLRVASRETPLQEKLNDLAERIAKLGFAAAIVMFVILIIRYFSYFGVDGAVSKEAVDIVSNIVKIVITSVTVVVVAVPEGLPLAVTLALAYATNRMLKSNNLVRVLSACETMGSATTVCSDKTGTLTMNRMELVRGVFGWDNVVRKPELRVFRPTSGETGVEKIEDMAKESMQYRNSANKHRNHFSNCSRRA